MVISMVLFLKWCLLLNLIGTATGACTFPSDLTGTWRSSRWDDIVFTSTEVTIPDFQGASLTFSCDNSEGTKYLIRSTTTKLLLGNNVEVTACLDFAQSASGVKYIYYHATVDLSLPGGEDQPVRLVVPGDSIIPSDTCTITSYSTGSNDVMIKLDSVASATQSCPIPLLANFDNYTVTAHGGGATYCDGVGYIHICDDSQTVLVEYGLCATELFYSSGGNLSCVHASSSGSVYYANLLNNDGTVDNSATYHYTCVVIETTGSIVYATQWPRKCHSSQTPTSIPSSIGYKFDMYTNLTCVPGGSSSGGFSIIPIIVSILLILIIAAACYYFLVRKKMYKKFPCYKKKSKKDNKVDPSSKSVSTATSRMDSQTSGLQATAVILPTDRSGTVTPFDRRNLDTAQSTRSAITVSHMDAEILEDQTPRRLPPIEPKTSNNSLENDTSETPSMVQRLPPINESQLGANEAGEDFFNSSVTSKGDAGGTGMVHDTSGATGMTALETSVPPEATRDSIDHGTSNSVF